MNLKIKRNTNRWQLQMRWPLTRTMDVLEDRLLKNDHFNGLYWTYTFLFKKAWARWSGNVPNQSKETRTFGQVLTPNWHVYDNQWHVMNNKFSFNIICQGLSDQYKRILSRAVLQTQSIAHVMPNHSKPHSRKLVITCVLADLNQCTCPTTRDNSEPEARVTFKLLKWIHALFLNLPF